MLNIIKNYVILISLKMKSYRFYDSKNIGQSKIAYRQNLVSSKLFADFRIDLTNYRHVACATRIPAVKVMFL